MAKKNPQWNLEGFEKLRNDHGIKAVLIEKAEEIADKASEGGRVDGYKVTDLVLEEPRGAVSVMATGHAAYHNRKTHSLLKSAGEVADG